MREPLIRLFFRAISINLTMTMLTDMFVLLPDSNTMTRN